MTHSLTSRPAERKAPPDFIERLREHSPATADRLDRLSQAQETAPKRRAAPTPTPPRPTPKPRPSARRAPAQHARASKAARAQQAERRRLRELRRDDRILDKVSQKIREAGGTIHRSEITRIPSTVWRMCAQIVADQSGRAARIYLARLSSRAAAGAILKAALENGQAWADMRARRIAALGVALETLSRRTRRPGPWGRVVMGITRPALCALLSNPFDKRARARPSTSAGFGEHRPGAAAAADSNQIGYFRALARNGAAYAQQLHPSQAAACERGFPSGHLPNRYWLAAEAHEQAQDEHRERLAALHIEANADADDLDRADTERRAQPPREPERPPG